MAAMPIHFFGKTFEGFASMDGDLEVLRIGETIQIGPQQRQAFGGDNLDPFVNGARIFGGKGLAEPLQRVAFTKPGQGGAGGMTHLRTAITATLAECGVNFAAVHRLPPA
jgi:hypothetical protein